MRVRPPSSQIGNLFGEIATCGPRRTPGVYLARTSPTGDERNRPAVVALDAHSLQDGGGDARFGSQRSIEAPDALHAGVTAVGIDDGAVAYDVVANDQAAGTGQLKRPVEVGRIIDPVSLALTRSPAATSIQNPKSKI